MTHGEIRAFDLRFRHQDGSWRNLEGTASNLLADAAVAGIVVNARDVTDRKRAEQELREREDQLRQAQKMEAIGRLAGGVAHDFNNLLTVINGYCEFLLSDMGAEHPLRSCTMEIQEGRPESGELTRQLLTFSRKQMVQPSVLDLNDVIRDSENMLRRVIGEDVEFICNLDGCPGGVEVDANQIHQVMMNLAANARDAMPSGGKLIIETSLIDVMQEVIHVFVPAVTSCSRSVIPAREWTSDPTTDFRAIFYPERTRKRHRTGAVYCLWNRRTEWWAHRGGKRGRQGSELPDLSTPG